MIVTSHPPAKLPGPAAVSRAATVRTWLSRCFLLAAALLFALHYAHLTADFPNHSPWMDWAKYTDEGWYGDAAIRHVELGHWFLRGDFNPGAALPVWPLLEGLLFTVTGVQIGVARGLAVTLFGLSLLASYSLLRRALPQSCSQSGSPHLAPAGAVLLLAASPFCYAFMRMAVTEPLLILLTLLALLTASSAQPAAPGPRAWLPAVLLGLLLPLMVLTKTTGLFLVPSIAWMLFARCGRRLRPFVRLASLAAGIAVALWLLYFGLAVRPRYLADFRYLFSVNAYTGITPATAADVLLTTVQDLRWIGSPLCLLAVLALVATLLWRPLRHSATAVSLVLWILGYAAFLAYHANLQPRYYLVIAIPATLLTALVLDLAWHEARRRSQPWLAAIPGVAALLLLLHLPADTRQTLHYVRTPEYTFLTAARGIAGIVQADHTRRPLLLSISGSDISLMTGLPSICDDFGTLELDDRIALYKPGWYASWNRVEDDKMDALTPLYHLERVAAFPAMDDPERNLLVLYRLDPLSGYRPPIHHRRRPLPRSRIARLGQQPSQTQLQH